MGEYIDVGLQSSILPFTLLISSVAVGLYALLGFETENDDDDSDSGSGGLMNPIQNNYLNFCPCVFLFNIFKTLEKNPKINIKVKIEEKSINIAKHISYKWDNESKKLSNNLLKLFKRLLKIIILLGIK